MHKCERAQDTPAGAPVPAATADRRVPALHRAMAHELRHVRELIEELADLLVQDPHFIENYLERLQTFDLLVQHMEEGAAILDRLAGGACSHGAIEPVRLGQVHARLHAAIAAEG